VKEVEDTDYQGGARSDTPFSTESAGDEVTKKRRHNRREKDAGCAESETTSRRGVEVFVPLRESLRERTSDQSSI